VLKKTGITPAAVTIAKAPKKAPPVAATSADLNDFAWAHRVMATTCSD
jgi:hypothetical protein